MLEKSNEKPDQLSDEYSISNLLKIADENPTDFLLLEG